MSRKHTRKTNPMADVHANAVIATGRAMEYTRMANQARIVAQRAMEQLQSMANVGAELHDMAHAADLALAATEAAISAMELAARSRRDVERILAGRPPMRD